ncbi:MAG TPA: 6,7-dimethyl-8-ribityllumazine synthase, partial [Gaiellaceae bacterium]|nr:6,7-dimethyl-8-ribityllumazine synthase [Gaiellaceae bacterium]
MSTSEQWPGEQRVAETVDEPEAEAGEVYEDDEQTADDEPAAAEEDAEPQLRLAGHAPADLELPDDVEVLEGEARGMRRGIAVVVARFNGEVTNKLLEAALAELDRLEVGRDSITVMAVPGAFELPLGAMAL